MPHSITKLAFTFAIVMGSFCAHAGLITVDADFNDNLTPAGFTLGTTNNSGITNQRLQALAINGSGVVSYAMDPNVTRVEVTYQAQFNWSQWGTYSEIYVAGAPITLSHGVNNYNHGNFNYALAGTPGFSETVLNGLNYAVFEYSLTITDGLFTWSGTDTSTNTETFNISGASAGIVVGDISSIGFRAHNTTGSSAVWVDNIHMELETAESSIPVPSPLMLSALFLPLGHRLQRSRA